MRPTGPAERALLEGVTARLAIAGCVAADEEAHELLDVAPDEAALDAMVARRERGEPLAWITGVCEFAGMRVAVEPGVYVPRAQSEELATRAVELLGANGRAADLCTGSGALAARIQAGRPGAFVVATDVDPLAVACARRNGVRGIVADLDLGLAGDAFDVVCAVTPYVPTEAMALLARDVTRYEPRRALDGGPDGLEIVRRLVTGAARVLRRGGWLLTEIGGDQGDLVAATLQDAGFAAPVLWTDEDGDLRGVAARWGDRRR